MTLCSISFKKVHREHLSPLIHLSISIFRPKMKTIEIEIKKKKIRKINENAYLIIDSSFDHS
jgi:hypothetical protein